MMQSFTLYKSWVAIGSQEEDAKEDGAYRIKLSFISRNQNQRCKWWCHKLVKCIKLFLVQANARVGIDHCNDTCFNSRLITSHHLFTTRHGPKFKRQNYIELNLSWFSVYTFINISTFIFFLFIFKKYGNFICLFIKYFKWRYWYFV